MQFAISLSVVAGVTPSAKLDTVHRHKVLTHKQRGSKQLQRNGLHAALQHKMPATAGQCNFQADANILCCAVRVQSHMLSPFSFLWHTCVVNNDIAINPQLCAIVRLDVQRECVGVRRLNVSEECCCPVVKAVITISKAQLQEAHVY